MQEDFIATGSEMLDKLDEYIRDCDAVVHLVGDMTGALAQAPSLAVIRQRYLDLVSRLPVLVPFLEPNAPAVSYTQWEAWLGLYHGKPLFIAAPQQAHLTRLAELERHPEITFADGNRLVVELLRSKLHEILALAGPPTRPVSLPYRSLGEFFKGREAAIEELVTKLG